MFDSLKFSNLPFIGFVPLMRLAAADQDLTPLGQIILDKTQNNPDDANTLMDLSVILQLRGYRDLGVQLQKQALDVQKIYFPPLTQKKTVLRVLMLMSSGDLMANSPIEFLVENADIELIQVYLTHADDIKIPLPEHDVLFVAIAYSEENTVLLKNIAPTLANWHRPVLNRPEQIAQLSRDLTCRCMENAEGILMPKTERFHLNELQNQLLAFPIIIRPVDSHAGHDLAKIESAKTLEIYLNKQTSHYFYITPFIDYKNEDGLFRKYRVVLIAGQPFLCHLAISEQWMIHYLNAGMAENAEKRFEEAKAMTTFNTIFAKKHAVAFQTIYERTELDYVGFDCAEMADGRLLIFEIDSCMIVHALDSADLFPYKQTPMSKLFLAFQQFLKQAAKNSK